MDLRQLTYFTEVVKLKSFTKASQSLHLTQPTLSKVIKAMEEELDMELLDRSSKHLELTHFGEIVYEEAVKIVAMVEDMNAMLKDKNQLKKGRIRIGLPPLGILFFPKILSGFKAKYPGIHIELVEHGANVVREKVDQGELDIGFAMLPVDEDLFDVIPFSTDQLMLLVHHTHPLASRKSVTLKALKDEPMIIFSKDYSLHDRIHQECHNAGFLPQVAYESSQFEFISELVRNDLGIAIFPEPFTYKVDKEMVKVLPIVNPPLYCENVILLKKGRYASRATREFLNYVVAKHSKLE